MPRSHRAEKAWEDGSDEGIASALPGFVKRELEGYLECGLMCRGFRGARLHGPGVPGAAPPSVLVLSGARDYEESAESCNVCTCEASGDVSCTDDECTCDAGYGEGMRDYVSDNPTE